MTFIFLAFALLGCGFLLYVLLQWARETKRKTPHGGLFDGGDEEADQRRLRVVSFRKGGEARGGPKSKTRKDDSEEREPSRRIGHA